MAIGAVFLSFSKLCHARKTCYQKRSRAFAGTVAAEGGRANANGEFKIRAGDFERFLKAFFRANSPYPFLPFLPAALRALMIPSSEVP
ncbi:MAG: hypothetical protein UX72_C0015G0010 [Parcubacteria group bacterium GW2011_GWA2_47_10]|nr:MAG: hypothetical protein UX72_C0015G0010 [Parcubacteria group bacterium GW2011_GWA2_47_10]